MVVPGRVAGCVAAHTGRVTDCVARARCRVIAPSGHDTKTISRPKSCRMSCRACCCACRSTLAPCRKALLRHIAALLLHIATQRTPPATIQHFYRDSPASQTVRALSHVLVHGQPCRGPCWPCRGAVLQGLLAVSWPPAANPSALCHDTIHCIVTQTTKWAVAHSSSCLFCNF